MKQLSIFLMVLITMGSIRSSQATLSIAEDVIEWMYMFADDDTLLERHAYDFLRFFGLFRASNPSTVKYLLWTRSNPDDFFNLQRNDLSSLTNSPFDGNRRTYFIIHGFMANSLSSTAIGTKDAILDIEDANIISISWETLADSPIYFPTALNVFDVAEYTARFIDFLVQNTDLSTSNIHIIGHSLGAHMAGIIGRLVNGEIDRISGLDPAGPLFACAPSSKRISPDSAAFVDIIHTSGQVIPAILGIPFPVGHVDFYPNGGDLQPGCRSRDTGTFDFISGCSHSRAYELFVDSITSQIPFTAYPCNTYAEFAAGGCRSCASGCNILGFNAIRENPGVFYLFTDDESPFAL